MAFLHGTTMTSEKSRPRPTTPEEEGIELHHDTMERLEQAVRTAARHGPIPAGTIEKAVRKPWEKPPAARRSERGEAIPVFRLEPIPTTLKDPLWQRSSVTECVWVKADSPDDARAKVANATLSHASRTGWIMFSPWYNASFTICVLDTAGTGVPEGAIIKANGQSI
jgi:hypothetical protein